MSLNYAEWQPIIGLPKTQEVKRMSTIVIEPIHFILVFIVALLFLTTK